MAGKTTLMVPIRVDALFVETDGLEFGSPFADFSQLPYKLSNDNKQNGNTPNLAEYTVVQSGTLAFPKGLHLHWALPDALTTGYHRDESAVFPAVPNRWLVRRLDQAGTLQKYWRILQRTADKLTLNISDLATRGQSQNSADFGVTMIAGVEKVRFIK